MAENKLSPESDRTLMQIESSLTSELASFMRELKKRHLEDPDEYPIDDGMQINEWFAASMNMMEW
jgi:hypothetical protein